MTFSKINVALVGFIGTLVLVIVAELGFIKGVESGQGKTVTKAPSYPNIVKPTPPPNAVSPNICPILAEYRVDANHKLRLFLEEFGYARNVEYNVVRKTSEGKDIKVDIRFALVNDAGDTLIKYNLISDTYTLMRVIDGQKTPLTDIHELKEGSKLKMTTIEDIRTVSGKREELTPLEVIIQ